MCVCIVPTESPHHSCTREDIVSRTCCSKALSVHSVKLNAGLSIYTSHTQTSCVPELEWRCRRKTYWPFSSQNSQGNWRWRCISCQDCMIWVFLKVYYEIDFFVFALFVQPVLGHELLVFVCAFVAALPLFSAWEQLPAGPCAVVTGATVFPAAVQIHVSLPHLFNGLVLTEWYHTLTVCKLHQRDGWWGGGVDV